MIDQLLATKLHQPILRKDMVRRGRLIERLNGGLWQHDGFERKLTLLSAPAGFGKTTLVSEWLHVLGSQQQPGPAGFQVAWLSLDESDNDPARFLAYLIAALGQAQPELGRKTGALLQSPQAPPPKIVLTSLVNELSSVPVWFILALDDYHVIHTPPIHEQIAFLFDNQPANLHMVILTREDPLLPLARLRARGQLLEIRQDDLRFTEEEAAELLDRETGISLSAGDIAALERHTEGWAAGLQLAALSLRGRDDLSAFIHDFVGSDRYILDYLLEEVFDLQPTDVKDFLLHTSVLKRLSGPLCDAVTGLDSGADVLRSLEHSNLFIVPLDPARTWYRYHYLFAELLRHRLRLSSFTEASLHRRASAWYESAGLPQEAVDHSIAAEDWGTVGRLIGKLSEGMLKRGEVVTLLGWLGRLPNEMIGASLQLLLVYAWAGLLASRFDIAAPLLEQAQRLAPPGSRELGQVAAAQAYLARSRHDNAGAIQKSEQALALLPSEDVVMRGNIALNLGLAYWHAGRIAEAKPVLEHACDLADQSGNLFGLLAGRIFLARIPAVEGKLHDAATILERLVQAGGQAPILCLAHYDLATIYHEWNDLRKASEHLEQGLALSLLSGNLEFQQSGQLLKAILAWARGKEADALEVLAEADTLGREFPPSVRSRAAALGVQLALAHSDLKLLQQWEKQVTAEVDAHSFYRFMGLTRPRLLIAQGDKNEASKILRTIDRAAADAGWGYGRLAARILQSLAAKTSEQALEFIADALRIGREEGFIRTFVDSGREVIPLLEEVASQGVEPEYAGQILSAMGVEGVGRGMARNALIEHLSVREIEVLQLVAGGLSNREIAARLFISLGTAKTHIHNLCGKLGVRNRTEAAMRAKELGLS